MLGARLIGVAVRCGHRAYLCDTGLLRREAMAYPHSVAHLCVPLIRQALKADLAMFAM